MLNSHFSEKPSRRCNANLPVTTELVGDAIDHPGIKAVSFTGSSGAGQKVAARAAAGLKPAVLELGGSDPCIVLNDADIQKACDVITLSRMINAGQSCIAAKRVIVEAGVYDDVCRELTQRFSALELGDPSQENQCIGPIAREDLRDQLHSQVMRSIQDGAKCLTGGEKPDMPGFVLSPYAAGRCRLLNGRVPRRNLRARTRRLQSSKPR